MDWCDLSECEPVYETMPGWKTSTVGITDFAALPQAAKNYIARLEAVCCIPINIISTGPDREHTIVLKNIF